MIRIFNFLSGFVVGIILGAAVGFLLAPKPGSETFQLLQTQINSVLAEARKAAEETRAQAHARLAELKAA